MDIREAPGRQDRIGQLADSLRGTREAPGGRDLDSSGRPGRHQGDSSRAGLPIESRFWKGAGFCITFNTISMAIGPVRGKSWGGLHGWLPVAQTGL